MMWLKGVLTARWFPYVAIGAVVGSGIVFGWGYLKGYNSAEQTYQKAMNEALAAQLTRLTALHAQDLATAVKQQTRVNDVRTRIKDVTRPPCTLSTECLRAFNDGVRASGTNPKPIN